MTQIQYFGFLQLIEKHLEGKLNEDDLKKLFGDFINLYQWQNHYKDKAEFVEELKTSMSFFGDLMMNGLLKEISSIHWNELQSNEERAQVKVKEEVKLLRVKDIQEKYGVSRQTVMNWINKHGLPIQPSPRNVYIKENDVLDFMNRFKSKK
jgi:predicted DNA-binding transcriptional regulator AlpA